MNLKSLLKTFKLNESVISMALGAVVIVIVGLLSLNYFKTSKKSGEIIPAANTETQKNNNTHTVSEGEDLWKISEKYYGTGYNWTLIAQENKIENPSQIEAGQVLVIPDDSSDIADSEVKSDEKTTDLIVSEPVNEPETETTGQKHIVKEGESLWKIAEAYLNSGYEWVEIAKANNIVTPSVINEGQELNIPQVEAKTADSRPAGKAENTDESIDGSSYTIEKGDSLWDIAVRAYSDGYRWVEIAKENSLENPDIIHPGNTLTLPR